MCGQPDDERVGAVQDVAGHGFVSQENISCIDGFWRLGVFLRGHSAVIAVALAAALNGLFPFYGSRFRKVPGSTWAVPIQSTGSNA